MPRTQIQPTVRRNGHAKAVLTFSSKARDQENRADETATVGGCKGLRQGGKRTFTWIVENGAAKNYRRLGKRLAVSGKLFRYGNGYALIRCCPEARPC